MVPGARVCDSASVTTLRIGSLSLAPGQFGVMAVVNRTPDSFYDQGATYHLEDALERVETVVQQGADIIDVGGVKAGSGAEVDTAEEIRRTVPFLAEVRRRHPDLPLSIDTWRVEVAREAVAAGADLINDAWSRADDALYTVAAETGAALVCSHVGGLAPRTDPVEVHYDDVVADVVARTTGLATHAMELGVRPDGLLLDPTHDFGKTTAHSLELTRRLDTLTGTGLPVLVSLSRKDFVGETLALPVDHRLSGTLAATTICAWHGARMFRVHDVAATRQTLDMVASILGTRPPAAPARGLPETERTS